MSIQGSIAKLTNNGAQMYLELAECFSTNGLVRATWTAFAQEKEKLLASLQSLPHAFWTRLSDQKDLEAALACPVPRTNNSEENRSLRHCISRALDFEEFLILRIYSRVVRRLRGDASERSLEFYILVKSNIARLSRTIEMFSGDPGLTRRSIALLQNFEKEVQAPETVESAFPTARPSPSPRKTLSAKARKRRSATTDRSRANHAISKRSKRLVKNVEVTRRRARV